MMWPWRSNILGFAVVIPIGAVIEFYHSIAAVQPRQRGTIPRPFSLNDSRRRCGQSYRLSGRPARGSR